MQLFRFLLVWKLVTLVIICPYLPGAGSDAFQGVSVFVGLLLSLGSAGIIGSVISGIILTYMRPFVIGEVTRIRTVRNEEITIPNGTLMGGGVVNYGSLAPEHGLVLHTSITSATTCRGRRCMPYWWQLPVGPARWRRTPLPSSSRKP